MIITIKVKTPKGEAKKTEKKLKGFIIGINKVKSETWTNEEDSEFYWKIEGGIKQIMNINRNLAFFDRLIKMIFENKLMKKMTGVKISKEEIEQLREMLVNQTSVEVIKESTLQEKDEHQQTFWQKVTKVFKKTESE